MNFTTFCYLIFNLLLCLEDIFLPTTFTHTHNHDPRPTTHTHDLYPLPTTHEILLHSFQASLTVNTWKISGMLIVWWPITINFKTREQTSKPQTNYRCCLRFGFLMPYWLFRRNTITFHKYFWCSRFSEFHSKLRQESNNKNRQTSLERGRNYRVPASSPF